jgi:hypothetical protein
LEIAGSQSGACPRRTLSDKDGKPVTNGVPLSYYDSELRNLRGVIAGDGTAHDRIVEITKSVTPGFL